MDYELEKLLQESVTISPYASRNDDNEFTYGTDVAVACRVQRKNIVIQDSQGRQVASGCQIYINGDETVGENSKITLADGTTPEILAIRTTPDEFGDAYYKCIYA